LLSQIAKFFFISYSVISQFSKRSSELIFNNINLNDEIKLFRKSSHDFPYHKKNKAYKMRTNKIAKLPARQNLFQPALQDEPFQQYLHHPNCSSVNDTELAQTIMGVWPGKKLPVNINFVFSVPFDLGYYYDTSRYHYRNVDAATKQLFQSQVRYVLNLTQAINNGIFNFNEIGQSFKANFSPFFRGIFFAQTATLNSFEEDGKAGFAIRKFDNNGYLKQAIVSLPTDFDLLNGTVSNYGKYWIYYAITHEAYHALGADHLHEFLEILAKLRDTPDGVFCSVLPYPHLIATNISSCHDLCNPGSAVFPGELDLRSMRLAYVLAEYNFNINKNFDYVRNGIFYLVFYLIVCSIYGGAEGFFSKLALKPYKYLFPKKLLEAILSIGLLIFFIEMDAPDYLSISFALFSALKFIPFLQKTRFFQDGSRSKKLLDSHYHLYVLAICSSIFEGVLPWPLYFTLALSFIGVFLGGVIAETSGMGLAIVLSYLMQLSIWYCCRRRSNENELQVIPEHLETVELTDFGIQSDTDILNEEDALDELKLDLSNLSEDSLTLTTSYEYTQPVSPTSPVEEKPYSEIPLATNPHGFYGSRFAAKISDFLAGKRFVELKEVEEDEEVVEFDAVEMSLTM
jgi:hypothetical protein